MASAEELIREAYFAFQNVSPGATDEGRQRALAKKFAMRILRQFPTSVEAEQARSILDSLKVAHAPARFVKTHSHSTGKRALAMPTDKPGQGSDEAGEAEWKALWQRFGRLPYLQKRILVFVLMFVVLFAAFTPFVWVFAFLLVVKRTAVKQSLHRVLVAMDPETRRKRS